MRKASWLISLLMVLSGMVACASREKAVMPSEEISAEQQQTLLRKKVAALLEKNSYRRALELMNGRANPGAPAAGMDREYLTAMNGMIATGEESLSKADYAVAGQSLRVVLDFYPVQASLRGKINRDQAQVRKQLETSGNRLLEQGLMEYRSGNLQNAISKWKEIITFDTGNKEAIKAIETATVQLRTLKNINKP